MTISGTRQSFEDFFTEAWPSAFRLASFLTQAGEDIAQDALAKMRNF